MKKTYGIIITNTGTPAAADTPSVRRYLREFLSDKRIVKIPRLVWLPILYGIILPFRSKKSAALYRNIWTSEGAPMRVIMQKLETKLQQALNSDGHHVFVTTGMNYDYPSIDEALTKLQAQHIDELIVLPLYPQYSNTTTASTFDRVCASLKSSPSLPGLMLIRDYCDHPAYIQALAESVRQFRGNTSDRHLLISFHGLPKRFAADGDPYPEQCETTSRLLAEALQLTEQQWTLCYQSQFGYDKWLEPSTQKLIEELPARGIKEVDVICPGFSIDCLETLEEIAIRGEEDFIKAGGKSLRMIPALNDSQGQINLLKSLVHPLLFPK